jgi:uncharacterized protein (TIGR02246 family)
MNRLLASCFATIVLSTFSISADDAKSTVAKLNEAWQSAYKVADSDRLAALYAEDAVVMAPGGEPLQGREAIRDFFAEDFKEFPKHSLTTKSLRVEACETLLVDSGEYKYDGVNNEGKPVHIMGNYITAFKKTDGSWHTEIEIWNERPPEGAAITRQ